MRKIRRTANENDGDDEKKEKENGLRLLTPVLEVYLSCCDGREMKWKLMECGGGKKRGSGRNRTRERRQRHVDIPDER